MTSKNFLLWAGWILIILAVVGFLNVIETEALYFDNAENWAHLILGVVALAIVYGVREEQTHKLAATVFGLVALVFGIWGFLVAGNPAPNFYSVTDLKTLDNILHLVVGVWGLWAAFGGKRE